MDINQDLILVLIIIFVSSTIRTTFGFGDALIAMPLLVIAVGIKTATPLVGLIASVIAGIILLFDWKRIDFKDIASLVIFTIVGIPFGLFYLKYAPESVIKIILGAILIIFSIFKLSNSISLKLRNNRLSPFFGIIAGMLGGAYNTNGPPILIYGTLRQWKTENFRAILQGVFLPTNIFITAGQGLAGLWTAKVMYYFLYSLPIVALSLYLGAFLNKKISGEKFSLYIYFLLIVLGLMLILNSIT